MTFDTPAKVWEIINAGEDVRRVRGENRALVNNAANGVPPVSDEEAAQMGLEVNCNFLEQAECHAQARRQYFTAYYGTQRFFTMQFKSTCVVPADKQIVWESWITAFINDKMRESDQYLELRRATDAAVVAHGIGPCAWYDRKRWCPKVVALEDLYVPTDTLVSFENLSWFGVRLAYTEWDLAKRVFGPNRLKGWNRKAVQDILHEYHDDNTENLDYDWLQSPEKMWELIKQNSGYYMSDAVPTIPLIHLFFQDTDENGEECWKMRVICDTEVKGGAEVNDEFLYHEGRPWDKDEAKPVEKPLGKKLSNILHCQFGDISNKAPFTVNAVRSLGFMLMEPCYWSNLLLCRAIQGTFEQLNIWLRSTDPAGKARAQIVNLFDKAFLPPGVSIVPANERHQMPLEALEMLMARMKQLQGEKSATYTQASDSGTQKEQTAFETMTKVQQVNAMMESLLMYSMIKEESKYREICRRFCLSDNDDPDCMEFLKESKKAGIPREFLNSERWSIRSEIPLGGGNPTMALAKAEKLMQMRGQFPPPAQQEILQLWAQTMTDPRTAARWVPLGKEKEVTSGQRDAEHALGDMMATGLPVKRDFRHSPIEQLEVMLTLLGAIVDGMEKDFNLVSANSLKGAQVSAQFAGGLLKELSERPDAKAEVKKFSKILGMILNALKGLAQRKAEELQKQQGKPDPAAMAKAQSIKEQSALKLKIKTLETQLKEATKAKSFKADETRKNLKLAMDEARKNKALKAEEQRKNTALMGEEHRANIATKEEVRRSKMKAFTDKEDKD